MPQPTQDTSSGRHGPIGKPGNPRRSVSTGAPLAGSPWGNISWSTMMQTFFGCKNLTALPAAAPNLSGVTDMTQMFGEASSFNQDLNNWNVSGVTNMNSMFFGAAAFNGNISSWNVGNVTAMGGLFRGETVFNQNISGWNVGKVTSMSQMFFEAKAFNQPINGWNVSNVTGMSLMFQEARAFNQDLNDWNVSKVTNMSTMFYNAVEFNGNIDNWDVSNVTNMSTMFLSAFKFNRNISGWNVAKVTNMSRMFDSAIAFNQDLNSWDVSKVTDMSRMFTSAMAFNGVISNWNTGMVTNMNMMFFNATLFNQDISGWNVSKVTDLSSMFTSATGFNQNLGNWVLAPTVNLTNMLNTSGLNSENYGLTLKGWAENPGTPTGRTLGATGLKFNAAAQPYKDLLVNTKGWTISDGGVLPVTLTAFGATADANRVNISWQTSSETSNSHFIIEKSTNGVDFTLLTRAEAKGNGTGATYSVYDYHPAHAANYYRLLQVDQDGKTTSHGVQAINFSVGKALSTVKVFPNPAVAAGTTQVSFPANTYQRAELTASSGKLLSALDIPVNGERIEFDTAALLPGIYIVRLLGKETSSSKLVKQ
jgi:surface protein